MFRLLLLFLLFLFGSCATTGTLSKLREPEHLYLEPITNRTSEEGLDVIFTQVADEVFYSDSRFKIDTFPIPDKTYVIKVAVNSVSSTAVGYDRRDIAREYMLSVKATVKVLKYGYKKPLYTFHVERYGFYDTYGTASEIEEKRRECLRRIAEQIFREVGERVYYGEGFKGTSRQ
ncbi:LPS assembly lipoprotein LptE [Thermovibrio sp.]